jgi:hypothetical protein
MIKEALMYKAPADTRDHDWIREIVLFETKTKKLKRLKRLMDIEKEEKRKEDLSNHDDNERCIVTDVKQKPEPGTHVKTQLTNGIYVRTVVPIMKDGRDLHSLQVGGNENHWQYCKSPCMGQTVVPIRNYLGYLNDKEYITKNNSVLRGKIHHWRLNSCKYLNDLHDMFERPKEAIEDQLHFAKYDILQVLKGIERFNVMCVSLMSLKAIMTYIEGVDDCEQAHFVYNMANCTKYELGVVTHDSEFNLSVFTMYDSDEDNKYAYGKDSIENLHHIHHERDNEKHRKMMEEEKNKLETTVSVKRELTIVENPYVTPEKRCKNDHKVVKTDV